MICPERAATAQWPAAAMAGIIVVVMADTDLRSAQ
jgi:hypothetical protein